MAGSKDKNITHLVSKNHESVVSLASDGSAHTLGRVTHGIKRQEVILSDLKLIPKVLQTSLKHASQQGTNTVKLWTERRPSDWGKDEKGEKTSVLL